MLQNVSKLLRQASCAAASSSRLGAMAMPLQLPLKTHVSTQHRLLHSSGTACAGDHGDDDKRGDKGTRPDEETALPAGATAAQLREWADRMLRRRAADAAQEGAASSSGARAAPGNLPEQAGMSDDLKEDELPPERAQSSLEDYDEGAQASDATVDGNAVEQQAADAKPDVSAWRRFVDERMGSDSWRMSDEASTSQPEQPQRAGAAEKQAPRPPKSGEPSSAEDILRMRNPMAELERLLPAHARRDGGLVGSGVIRRQEDYEAPEQLPFKATEGTPIMEPGPPPPKRLTVVEVPMDHHANPATGYSQLGDPTQTQEEAQREARAAASAAQGGARLRPRDILLEEMRRLHPTRTFFPGQLYEPEDLVVSTTAEWRRTKAGTTQTKKASNHDVREQADFRNQAFLNRFISELGKLPPQRTTRLQRKTHRHLCRTIKLARNMALLPIDSQLPQEYLQRTGAVAKQGAADTMERNPRVQAFRADSRPRERYGDSRGGRPLWPRVASGPLFPPKAP